MQKVLVTGAAGFIGMHTAVALVRNGYQVIGVDHLGPYLEPKLKEDRLKILRKLSRFEFQKLDLSNAKKTLDLCRSERFDHVVHLAAQAGVRNGPEYNDVYFQSNLQGFYNILESIREYPVKNFLFASSSSVYGKNSTLPFQESQSTAQPVSFYAATKIAGEAMAHSFAHLHKIPTTGLRFFTVYGPWGRPDMAPILFAKALFEERQIELFNNGQMRRDFTYIDDVVWSIIRLLDTPKSFRVLNIGNSSPIHLQDFMTAMESAVGKKARIVEKPMHPGDVLETFADVALLKKEIDFRPSTTLGDGVAQFMKWFKDYYAY